MTDTPAVDVSVSFDRFAPAYLDDPYPLYRELRNGPGVFYADAFGLWVVTRYDDVRTVLNDSDRFSSAYLIRTPHSPAPGVTDVLAQGCPEVRILLNQDPPEHARARSLVNAAFSPRRVRALQPRVQAITDQLVDDIAVGDGHADLVRGLAWPLPLHVICELIGLPAGDAEQVRAWTDDLAVLTSYGASPEQQLAAARGSVAFERYLADQADQRRHDRHDRRDDLLTDLATAAADGQAPLSTEEIVSLLMILVFAGHETTANLIGTTLLLLLQRPHLWAAATDYGLVDAAIEETLRADAPVQGMFRRTVAETDLAGVTIPAGAQVFALIGSANRDPAVFGEPDVFDPDRIGATAHLSFGRGIHFCIGAALARLEARTAVTTLARRLPGLRLAPGFSAPYLPNLLHRGPTRLDTTLT